MVIREKRCIDCGKIRRINHNAQRCYYCAQKRRVYMDKLRYKKRRKTKQLPLGLGYHIPDEHDEV